MSNDMPVVNEQYLPSFDAAVPRSSIDDYAILDLKRNFTYSNDPDFTKSAKLCTYIAKGMIEIESDPVQEKLEDPYLLAIKSAMLLGTFQKSINMGGEGWDFSDVQPETYHSGWCDLVNLGVLPEGISWLVR